MGQLRDLRQELQDLLQAYEGRLPVINAVVAGSPPPEQLRAMGARLYAEARSALQVKIPERLRLCPLELGEVRRFWCHILAEESGDFQKGQDHGSLIAITCRALGTSQEQLDVEYEHYLPRLDAIRREPPSLKATLRELTRMYVEEAVLAREANKLGDALRDHYGIPEEALYYFRLHAVADIEHSNAALDELTRYATTAELKDLVVRTAQEALAQFPIWLQDAQP